MTDPKPETHDWQALIAQWQTVMPADYEIKRWSPLMRNCLAIARDCRQCPISKFYNREWSGEDACAAAAYADSPGACMVPMAVQQMIDRKVSPGAAKKAMANRWKESRKDPLTPDEVMAKLAGMGGEARGIDLWQALGLRHSNGMRKQVALLLAQGKITQHGCRKRRRFKIV